MKYIELFESWQGFNKNKESEKEREYRVTVDEILTWAAGPDWSDDWSWMPDILMVDDEFPEDENCIGYLELLKKNSDLEVDVYSQELGGQTSSTWVIEDTVFDLISWDWPFEEEEDLEELETSVVRKLQDEIGEEGLRRIGATVVDVIDFVDWSSERGEDLTGLTSTGFKNWLGLQRGGAN
jgi:hypothetical protein